MIETIPIDEALEREILGSMLYDPACIAQVVESIEEEDFYYQKHKALYSELVRLWNQDERLVNAVELVPFIEKNNMTVTEMSQLSGAIVSTASIDFHVEKLKSLSHLRKLVVTASEIAAWGNLKDRDEIKAALNLAEDKIARITDKAVSSSAFTSMPNALANFQTAFDHAYTNKNAITGITSGFCDLDAITTGFKKQELVILAARTGLGKTAFAVQLALNMRDAGHKGVFYELEMNEHSVTARMVANKAKVDSNCLVTGMISREEKQRIDQVIATMSRESDGLYLDTTANMSLFEMKAKARKLKRNDELDFIIVDYLQLLTVPKGNSRIEEVSMITRELKLLARELDVPVFALSQLSRAVEQRQDKRPMLSDLRESGSIEQDADIVMFLYRDDYYNEESENKGVTEVIVGKQRNGAVGTAKLLFEREKSRFLPLTRVDEEPPDKEIAATESDYLDFEEVEFL